MVKFNPMEKKDYVLKSSGGKFFIAPAPPWTGLSSGEMKRRYPGIAAQNTAFSTAANGCKSESKAKGGTVWGVSKFNQCIGRRLGGKE